VKSLPDNSKYQSQEQTLSPVDKTGIGLNLMVQRILLDSVGKSMKILIQTAQNPVDSYMTRSQPVTNWERPYLVDIFDMQGRQQSMKRNPQDKPCK